MYKRWRVYSTFFTGLLIGLGFAVLMGMPMEVQPDVSVDAVANAGEAVTDWKVFVLMMFGILGGVIYPIVTDGFIEMPRFIVNQGGRFKAGLFGDILLGIAGATILELLLPSDLSIFSPDNGPVTSTAVAATGLLGGYGGRAILRFALARVVKAGGALGERTLEIETSSYEREDRRGAWGAGERGRSSSVSDNSVSNDVTLSPQLISVLAAYVRQGDTEQSWASIKQQILSLPVDRLQPLFDFLVEQRNLNAPVEARVSAFATGPFGGRQTPLTSDQLQRLIPAFEAIAQRGWQTHQCDGQIALIYSELSPPEYAKALVYVDRALAARGPLTLGQPWDYELHRAAIRIEQSTENEANAETYQSEIIGDLLAIAQVYNLETLLTSAAQSSQATLVLDWMNRHQALLAASVETRFLVTAPTPIQEQRPATLPKNIPAKPPKSPPKNIPAKPPENPNNYRLSNRDLVVGQGFNLLSLDPFNISGSAKRDTIFRFYDGEALEIQDEGLKLHPKGTKYSAISYGGSSTDSRTRVLYTEADAQRFFASSLGGIAASILGAILPCSLSGSYEKIKRERSLEKQIYSFTKADYIHYRLDLIWDAPEDLHLDRLFRQAVAQLPLREELQDGVSAGEREGVSAGEREGVSAETRHEASDGKEILPYLDFIEKYGTHVSVQVQMGGLVHQRISLSESLYASVVKKGANLEAEAQKMFTARVASASESSTYREIREHSEHLQFCGGMMECDNIYEWFGTVKGDPAPVKVELRSLHEVLSPAFFPNDSTILQKQALLADVIQHYLEETSEPPVWELWRSVAVGGDGGDAFSSIDCSPTLQDQNQAQYEQTQVSAVRVKIGSSWIEGVEMVMVGEPRPLSAQEQADSGVRVLTLAPGDYITSVRVMPGTAGILRDRSTYVGFIELITHQNQRLSVGTPDDRATVLDIPEGYQVIGFHGRQGRYMDRLGVISAPIPAALVGSAAATGGNIRQTELNKI